MVALTRAAGREDAFLRRTLMGNAIFSAVSGTAFIAAAGPISRFLGLESAFIPAAIGVGLFGWVVLVGWTARQEVIERRAVKEIIAGDVAWLAASWLILLAGWPELTTGGSWAVAAMAEAVSIFAILQYLGLRRLTGR